MKPKAGEYNGSAQGIFLKSPDLFQLEYLKDGAITHFEINLN